MLGVLKEEQTMHETIPQNKRAFGLDEISAQTSLSVAFLRKEACAGNLKTKKFGARRLVLKEDLETYLNGEEK